MPDGIKKATQAILISLCLLKDQRGRNKLIRKSSLIAAAIVALVIFCPSIVSPNFPDEVSHALHTPELVVLYSIYPEYKNPEPHSKQKLFHSYPVLGKLELSGEEAAKAALEFDKSVPAEERRWDIAFPWWNRSVSVHNCVFSPRHGLQVTSDGQTYDLLLCYACGDIKVFIKNKNIAKVIADNGSPEILNRMLDAAHITRARSKASE